MSSEEQIIILLEENKRLREIIRKLESRISYLEEELRKAKLKKDSSNSDKPPSTDITQASRNQSLRVKTGKKPGGQEGHKGITLKMVEKPDEIVKLEPNYCRHCGCSLEGEEAELNSKRQVIDIPPIKPIVTEYQNYKKRCPKCGHYQQAGFPAGVNNHIQYGSNIEAAIVYFSVYQYLPYKRLKECLKHLINIEISQGSINNILKRMSMKAEPIYNKIKEKISFSKQVGSDETSAKVNGKKWWIWVWQSVPLTYLTASKSRGSQAIQEEFPTGLKESVLTTDRWAAQLKTIAKGHQLCTAHLLRDLKYLKELEKNQWASRMEQLLKAALDLKSKRSECVQNDIEAVRLEESLDILLQQDIPKETNHKTYVFQQSLIKQRASIFTFLYNKSTPADNNASERAIRNVKVKQKVSGQFKAGQHLFCVLRSIIDTCNKNAVDILFALKSIANFIPAE